MIPLGSFYFAPGVGESWEHRISGLSDPDQLAFEDMIPDPWSEFKQGYNPNRVIVWGCGKGFLVRSEDTGQTWKDRTSFLTAPGWDGDAAVDISEISLIRLVVDIFTEDQMFALARWQVGGLWRGAVGKSTDGFNFTWYNLTGSSQVRPLGLSLNRGNGATLWVTTWDSSPGALSLKKINVADMSISDSYDMGAATSGNVDAQIYFATPFSRLGQTSEVFIYGRMNDPQDTGSGTVHVLKNDNSGQTGSYSVVECGWGNSLCGSFGADEDGYYYAIRNAV